MTRLRHVRQRTHLVSALLTIAAMTGAQAAPIQSHQDFVAAIDSLRPSKVLGERLDSEKPTQMDGPAAVRDLSERLIAAQISNSAWQSGSQVATLEALLIALADSALGKSRLPESV